MSYLNEIIPRSERIELEVAAATFNANLARLTYAMQFFFLKRYWQWD